jgi:8-amino-7-oxononanoate synthase
MRYFADKLNHASLIDAMQLAKANGADSPALSAQRSRGAGTDAGSEHAAKRKLIVTDAVFSMDGDLAPLPLLLRTGRALRRLAGHRRRARLRRPRPARRRAASPTFNLPASPRIVLMGTLGKAAGVVRRLRRRLGHGHRIPAAARAAATSSPPPPRRPSPAR